MSDQISKAILLFLAILSLTFGSWAGQTAFADTTLPISTLGMMGMLGYFFHAAVLLASLRFPANVRQTLTLLLLVWHIPETILIATQGMGIPADDRPMGIAIHAGFSALAALAWFLSRSSERQPAAA